MRPNEGRHTISMLSQSGLDMRCHTSDPLLPCLVKPCVNQNYRSLSDAEFGLTWMSFSLPTCRIDSDMRLVECDGFETFV